MDDYKALMLQLSGIRGAGAGIPSQRAVRSALRLASGGFLRSRCRSTTPRSPRAVTPTGTATTARPSSWRSKASSKAEFQEGMLIRAKAGDVYSEPIAKFHRGHNPHPDLPYVCIAFCVTPPGCEHVTNVEKPW